MQESERSKHPLPETIAGTYNIKTLLNGRYLSYIHLNKYSISEPLPLDITFNRIVKRTIDIVISVVAIVCVLSWLLPIIALLIKLDSKGRVFFAQKRNKRNGRQFTCIKFRTMIGNSEADTRPAISGDERITRVGRVLRNHYLDELPQFFNVFMGDMSVIGPRPHMIHENRKYEQLLDNYKWRYKVKPGITGLAQVMGYVGSTAATEDMVKRVYMDISYVRHWSIPLDAMIILRTFLTLLGFKNYH